MNVIPDNLTQRLQKAISEARLEIKNVSGIKLALLKQEGINNLSLNTSGINQFWQNMPYWAFAWACGQAMADWIQLHPEYIENKRVLDLGTGSGLVAIKAASLGAKRVYISDLDSYAHQAAHFNAKLNQQILHDWQQEPVDLLLSSDLLYDISSHPDLQKLVADIPEVLIAETPKVLTDSFLGHNLIHQTQSSTFPQIVGFDESLSVHILHRYASQNIENE